MTLICLRYVGGDKVREQDHCVLVEIPIISHNVVGTWN